MPSLSRRLALQLMTLGSTWSSWLPKRESRAETVDDPPSHVASESWQRSRNRIWIGGEYWANPMEDWRLVDGAVECQSAGGNRNLHLLTYQLTDATSAFEMTVRLSRVEVNQVDGGAGLRIGNRSELNEYRSNCFVSNGIDAGMVSDTLRLGERTLKISRPHDQPVSLRLSGQPKGNRYHLELVAWSHDDQRLGAIEYAVAPDTILGNVSIVNNFDNQIKKSDGARYRFLDLTLAGPAFKHSPQHRFGPILWAMYTLNDSRSEEGFQLTFNVLTGPLGDASQHKLELMVDSPEGWQSMGISNLDPDAWTGKFRVSHWDATREAKVQIVLRHGADLLDIWNAKVKPDPQDRPLRMAALTCQKDYAFPYEPVADNVLKLDPDLVYFSGDQLYEDHGGYGLIRDPAEAAILNYLRKFYLFGWAFREVMRDRPTLCIPDDHDVFQGNIWGEYGANMKPGNTSSRGGYREPPRMVNVVHRTCAGHHPDCYDPTPVKQGISVYYGDMVYGKVGFAILGDRQFKSGPEHVDRGSGRADHVVDADFDTTTLDQPGLDLLGKRQEDFLRHWVTDWRGHSMKVLLSQTVFAAVATHHGRYDGYLKADLDSGGWPQTARDRTIAILRQGMPLHINGDQHLTSLVQYGVERQRDACWSFCVPAIAAGYPRWWRPDEIEMPHQNRPDHQLPHTGEFLDGLGNMAYVYATGNPLVATKKHRYQRAHQKGSGFGFVTIDTHNKTYHIEAFRFLVNATDGQTANQFPGWPLTIHQHENKGDNRVG